MTEISITKELLNAVETLQVEICHCYCDDYRRHSSKCETHSKDCFMIEYKKLIERTKKQFPKQPRGE